MCDVRNGIAEPGQDPEAATKPEVLPDDPLLLSFRAGPCCAFHLAVDFISTDTVCPKTFAGCALLHEADVDCEFCACSVQIDDLIDIVEKDPIRRPLENPAIFDNWQVTYVSTAQASKQQGQRKPLYCSEAFVHHVKIIEPAETETIGGGHAIVRQRGGPLHHFACICIKYQMQEKWNRSRCRSCWRTVQRAHWAPHIQIDGALSKCYRPQHHYE